MLHIILLILKIVGIILAALLGLLLLTLLLLLFVPIRYKAVFYKEKDWEIKAKLTWLMHMISVPAAFQDGRLSIKIKLLGFTVKRKEENEEEAEAKADELLRDAGTVIEQEEERISTGEESDLSNEDTSDTGAEEHFAELPSVEEEDSEAGEIIQKKEEVNEEKAEKEEDSNNLVKRMIGKIKAFSLRFSKYWLKLEILNIHSADFVVE